MLLAMLLAMLLPCQPPLLPTPISTHSNTPPRRASECASVVALQLAGRVLVPRCWLLSIVAPGVAVASWDM